MSPPEESVDDRLPWRTTRLPLALVLLSLLSLVVVPILIQRRAAATREEITRIVDPALRSVDRIQLALALEVSAVRGFLLTGDDRFLDRYREAVVEEERAFARLVPLARSLGPEILALVTRLSTLRMRWAAPVDSLLAGRLSAADLVARLPEQQTIIEARAVAAADLNEALVREAVLRLERIEEIERLGTWLTLLLVLFALVAALFVERLGARMRTVAARFERRAREEAALRRAAEAVTTAFTVEEVIRRIAESAVQAVGADGAFVERIDLERNEVEVVAVAGEIKPPIGARLPYRGSFAEAVMARREPELVPDLAAAGRPLPDDLARTCAHCAAMVVPLVDAGEAIGVLTLLRRPERPPFQTVEIARAHTFAALAALAFYKIHLLEESERRRLELERTIESRARLMRGFGHDVKNPLGAADGYAQLLEEGLMNGLTPKQKESVQRIRRAIQAALRLIDDLLDIARAEAGKLEIVREPVNVRTVAAEIAEEFRAAAEARGLALEAQLPEEVPVIESDVSRLRQILGNLVSNAVKYTPKGGRITVRAGVREGGEAPGPGRWVVVDVSDTGPGVPEEKQEVIFQEFTRAEPGTERGVGIGLAISRTLARAMGGDITVESRSGRGATFTLWLPLRAGNAREPDRSPASAPPL